VTHTELAKCWTTLGDAAASTLNKYGHSTTAQTELISMRRVVDVLGVQAKVAVCHPDGAIAEPLGFCIYYEHAKTVFIRWIGFDTSKLRDVEEYYNTLFYTQIERAASAGIRWIHAGATTPAAKALRGAELRPLWLLDLTADSPLDDVSDAIIEHNHSMLEELHADPRTTKAVAPAEDWTAFG
jgi:hypothetical protein